MALENWTQRPDGSLRISPLVGFQTARYETVGLVRLMFATSAERLAAEQFDDLQVAVNPNILRDLAQSMLRLADQIDQQPLGPRQ